MISVDEAQARLLALASPLPPVELPLARAVRHVLRAPVVATRTQPAADLSAMDGYAIISSDFPGPWRIIGESAAGHPFPGALHKGEAVRIFTGAHVPQNADSILIQEDAGRDGDLLQATSLSTSTPGANIRRAGGDFVVGDMLLPDGIVLDAGPIALAAMAGMGSLMVGRPPRVAILATGDELVPAGSACSQAQIPSSNTPMLLAMLTGVPCEIEDAGIIADNLDVLEGSLASLSKHADIIVTTGGASVGDHDFVQTALLNIGADMDFWKVAIRPGKPIMAGKIGNTVVLGLPGNPSSAFVTAFLFLLPLVRHLAGSKAPFPEYCDGVTEHDLPSGGNRTEYLRARVEAGRILEIFRQDSGLTLPLARANALVVQPSFVQCRIAGTVVQYMLL